LFLGRRVFARRWSAGSEIHSAHAAADLDLGNTVRELLETLLQLFPIFNNLS
jgi:hypothetical protein